MLILILILILILEVFNIATKKSFISKIEHFFRVFKNMFHSIRLIKCDSVSSYAKKNKDIKKNKITFGKRLPGKL